MKRSSNKGLALSIVILNYNTRELLINCLTSIRKVIDEIECEVIVVDNASNDGSVEAIQKLKIKDQIFRSRLKTISNENNFGFAKGNNSARSEVLGRYVLFLNSDTEVYKGTLAETVSYMQKNEDIGALTCKLVMPDGKFDKDSRRSFPTPWVALTHFSGLDRIFPSSKLFAKYWYWNKDVNETCEVDAIQGAFFLSPREVLEKVNWFDEDYFLDGEDLDLCWKIRQIGKKIIYYPKVKILHIKKASKAKAKGKYANRGVVAMMLFYKKHLSNRYPMLVNIAVFAGIYLLMFYRTIKSFALRFI